VIQWSWRQTLNLHLVEVALLPVVRRQCWLNPLVSSSLAWVHQALAEPRASIAGFAGPTGQTTRPRPRTSEWWARRALSLYSAAGRERGDPLLVEIVSRIENNIADQDDFDALLFGQNPAPSEVRYQWPVTSWTCCSIALCLENCQDIGYGQRAELQEPRSMIPGHVVPKRVVDSIRETWDEWLTLGAVVRPVRWRAIERGGVELPDSEVRRAADAQCFHRACAILATHPSSGMAAHLAKIPPMPDGVTMQQAIVLAGQNSWPVSLAYLGVDGRLEKQRTVGGPFVLVLVFAELTREAHWLPIRGNTEMGLRGSMTLHALMPHKFCDPDAHQSAIDGWQEKIQIPVQPARKPTPTRSEQKESPPGSDTSSQRRRKRRSKGKDVVSPTVRVKPIPVSNTFSVLPDFGPQEEEAGPQEQSSSSADDVELSIAAELTARLNRLRAREGPRVGVGPEAKLRAVREHLDATLGRRNAGGPPSFSPPSSGSSTPSSSGGSDGWDEALQRVEAAEVDGRQEIVDEGKAFYQDALQKWRMLPRDGVVPDPGLCYIHCRSACPPPARPYHAQGLLDRNSTWERIGGEARPSEWKAGSEPTRCEMTLNPKWHILVEMRPECLVNYRISDRHVLFARPQPQHLDSDCHADGSYDPAYFGTITTQCLSFLGPKVWTLDAPWTSVFEGQRYWFYRPILEHRTRFIPRAVEQFLDRNFSYVRETASYARGEIVPTATDLPMPTVQATARVLYRLAALASPDETRALVHEAKNEALVQKDPLRCDPIDVARSINRQHRNLAKHNKIPGFTVPRSERVNCQCCQRPPPKKYRWKHRICENCRRMLGKFGAVSGMGVQLQQRLQVPDGNPGLVFLPDLEVRPNLKKWRSVDLKTPDVDGAKPAVWVNWDKVQDKKAMTTRWERVEDADELLEKLGQLKSEEVRTAMLGGIGCSGATVMVSAKTPFNQFKALAGRLFRMPKTRPRKGAFQWLAACYTSILPDLKAEPMEFPDWLLTMRPSRRRALLRAWETLQRIGWKKRDERFQAFVKTELLPDFSKEMTVAIGQQDERELQELHGDLEMLDRGINGPLDPAHTVVGPVTKPLTLKLKEIWSQFGPIFYASAKPAVMHSWLQRLVAAEKCGRTFFWCDYSMFDATHSCDSWQFIESIYRQSCSDPLVFRILKAWRTPGGSFGAFRYQARNMNASGRDDTALANGILNGLIIYISVLAALLAKDPMSLTIEDLRSGADSIFVGVAGDDSLGSVALEGRSAEQFQAAVKANVAVFGFEAKLCLSERLDDCIFLGNRAYRRSGTEERWWGKTIGRSTYKLGWVRETGRADLLAITTGVHQMHRDCSAIVPILWDIADQVSILRTGRKSTPYLFDEDRPWTEQQPTPPYDETTLQQVADLYTRRRTLLCPGEVAETEVTVASLKHLIKAIRSVHTLPAVIDSPTWRLLIAADEL